MGFSRGLAAEVGRDGVTVNCIALGTMKHGLLAEAIERRARARSAARQGVPRRAHRPGRRSRAARRAAVQRRRGVDHRPGVPGRRRLRPRALTPLRSARPSLQWRGIQLCLVGLVLLSKPDGSARRRHVAGRKPAAEAPSQHSPACSVAPDRLGAQSRSRRTPAPRPRRRRRRGRAPGRRRAHGPRARLRSGRSVGGASPTAAPPARPGPDRLPAGVLGFAVLLFAGYRPDGLGADDLDDETEDEDDERAGAGAAAHRPGDRPRDARRGRVLPPRRSASPRSTRRRAAQRRRSVGRRRGLAARGHRRRRRHGRHPRRPRAARAPARAGRPDARRVRRDRGRGALGWPRR